MIEISVIIPIYNAEKYLTRCINSVLSQINVCTEIILIDNNSTDNSKIILEEFCQKHRNIILLFEKKKGVSNARNLGILHATGRFIFFLDADDYLYSQTTLYNMLCFINKSNCDIVIGNYVYRHKQIYKTTNIKNNIFNNHSQIINIENYLNQVNLFEWPVWGKLFKREIINKHNLLFDSNLISCEDCKFLFDYFNITNSIQCIDEIIIHYENNADSLTKQKSYYSTFSEFKVLSSYIELYKKLDSKLLVNYFTSALLLKIKQIANFNKKEKNSLKFFLNIFKENIKYLDKSQPKILFSYLIYKLFGFNIGSKLLNKL